MTNGKVTQFTYVLVLSPNLKFPSIFTTFPSKASILLTANVAFLAIPSNNSNNLYIRSATQIASYVSVVASSSSMMLALLLRRQHRTRERGTALAVVRLVV